MKRIFSPPLQNYFKYESIIVIKPKHGHSQDKSRTQTIVSGAILDIVIVILLLRWSLMTAGLMRPRCLVLNPAWVKACALSELAIRSSWWVIAVRGHLHKEPFQFIWLFCGIGLLAIIKLKRMTSRQVFSTSSESDNKILSALFWEIWQMYITLDGLLKAY